MTYRETAELIARQLTPRALANCLKCALSVPSAMTAPSPVNGSRMSVSGGECDSIRDG